SVVAARSRSRASRCRLHPALSVLESRARRSIHPDRRTHAVARHTADGVHERDDLVRLAPAARLRAVPDDGDPPREGFVRYLIRTSTPNFRKFVYVAAAVTVWCVSSS